MKTDIEAMLPKTCSTISRAIAETLTGDQCDLLLNLAFPVAFGCYFSSASDEQALRAAGLIEEASGDDVPDATPLGLQVAEFIMAQDAAANRDGA